MQGCDEVMKLACKDYADWLGLELLDSSGGLNDPFNLSGSTAVRKVDIKLGVPTYFDGLGNCSDDITLYVCE